MQVLVGFLIGGGIGLILAQLLTLAFIERKAIRAWLALWDWVVIGAWASLVLVGLFSWWVLWAFL